MFYDGNTWWAQLETGELTEYVPPSFNACSSCPYNIGSSEEPDCHAECGEQNSDTNAGKR